MSQKIKIKNNKNFLQQRTREVEFKQSLLLSPEVVSHSELSQNYGTGTSGVLIGSTEVGNLMGSRQPRRYLGSIDCDGSSID